MATPEVAEWAEVTLRTGALPDGPHNIVFHAVPSARRRAPRVSRDKKILQLREYATEKVMVPVRGGASLEICMQLLWLQNPSAVELTADVEFHSFGMRGMSKLVGRIFGGRSFGVRLGAADGFARVELSAPLRPERLRPKAQLTNVERALRPSSAKISAGSAELDVLPPSDAELRASPETAGRQIHQMVLTYDVEVAASGDEKEGEPPAGQSAILRVAALFSQLYDSPLDSMIWRLDDGRGATLAHGGAMHDSSPVSLKPGAKYKASVLLRHPDAAQLEKLKDTLLLEMPPAKALDCLVHAEREAAAKLGAKPIDDGWRPRRRARNRGDAQRQFRAGWRRATSPSASSRSTAARRR